MAEQHIMDWAKTTLKAINLFNANNVITSKFNNFKLKLTAEESRFERNRRISLSLISCETPEEFYNVCRQLCPPGTIIDEYESIKTQCEELFTNKVQLAKIELFRGLLDAQNSKKAELLLKVLERRDRSRWAESQKQLKIEQKKTEEDSPESLTIEIVGL